MSGPSAPFAAMIAPRREQSAGASVQAIAVAGSGSSILSTVKVAAAWAARRRQRQPGGGAESEQHGPAKEPPSPRRGHRHGAPVVCPAGVGVGTDPSWSTWGCSSSGVRCERQRRLRRGRSTPGVNVRRRLPWTFRPGKAEGRRSAQDQRQVAELIRSRRLQDPWIRGRPSVAACRCRMICTNRRADRYLDRAACLQLDGSRAASNRSLTVGFCSIPVASDRTGTPKRGDNEVNDTTNRRPKHQIGPVENSSPGRLHVRYHDHGHRCRRCVPDDVAGGRCRSREHGETGGVTGFAATNIIVVVTVLPARVEWLDALLESDEVFAARFGIPVVAGWVGFPEALPAAVDAARCRSEDPWGTICSSTMMARWSASAGSRVSRTTVRSSSATPLRGASRAWRRHGRGRAVGQSRPHGRCACRECSHAC